MRVGRGDDKALNSGFIPIVPSAVFGNLLQMAVN